MVNQTADTSRHIRSYVLRQGRMTVAQSRAITELLPRYAIELPGEGEPLSLAEHFPSEQPLVIEIGFGMGDSLLRLARENSAKNFIGIEMHLPGVGNLLSCIDAHAITNLRVIRGDAILALSHFREKSIDEILIYFPDPWPKKRHHKRRIIQSAFVDLLSTKIKAGGILHIATDWANYAEHIDTVFQDRTDFTRSNIPHPRPDTKFETRGKRLGHEIFDLVYAAHR